MPLKCAEQERIENRTARVDRIIRDSKTNQPTEVEFTLVDTDGSHQQGYFFVPEGFDDGMLHQGAAEIWPVRTGVMQNGWGDAHLVVKAINVCNTWIEDFKPLKPQ